MSRFVSIILLAIFFVLYNQFKVEAQTKNGFNLKGAIIPVNEIMNGGPPRDGFRQLIILNLEGRIKLSIQMKMQEYWGYI